MPILEWDKTAEHFYETGVDHGVLFVQKADGTYENGVAWNGLSAVTESPSGAESNPVYADNIKYLDLRSVEEFGATIEAYTYPDEFGICDGTAEPATGLTVGQQPRRRFGFVYRTRLGNDTVGDDLGYKLHLIYNATASPSEKAYNTVNDSPEANTFSWEVTTTAVALTTVNSATGKVFAPTACLTIDSTKADATKLAALEKTLFGDTGENAFATLPTPDQVIAALT